MSPSDKNSDKAVILQTSSYSGNREQANHQNEAEETVVVLVIQGISTSQSQEGS